MLNSIQTFLTAAEERLQSGLATEHSYRGILEQLFTATLAQVLPINEPKRAYFGEDLNAPDFKILRKGQPLGHVETKDVGTNLEAIIKDSELLEPKTINGNQIRRYRAAYPNLLFTDGLEWHWFVEGQPKPPPIRIARLDKKHQALIPNQGGMDQLAILLTRFDHQKTFSRMLPAELAQKLAVVARWLADVIREELLSQIAAAHAEGSSAPAPFLKQVFSEFQESLLPSLKPADFADMYAQTLVYGLFAARVAAPTDLTFSLATAQQFIPPSNPFLGKLFAFAVDTPDLNDSFNNRLVDLAHLLATIDLEPILEDFGKATKQQDPVIHFYETFLEAYNPKTRKQRGVYYTPEPVVSYIVRSVDRLLKKHFAKPLGLTDPETIILDPATGTGTFLHSVIQQIHQDFNPKKVGKPWLEYVQSDLIPRLFGFELLMAPYTIAHLKLSLLLQNLNYRFHKNERLAIYLTNTLADSPLLKDYLKLGTFIVEEGQQAQAAKLDKPVMVVLGNPPYANYGMLNAGVKHTWIGLLLEDYKRNLMEKKINLDDDFIKFMRFGQWRIAKTGNGILAFITNNTYIDGITHRQMRESLLNTFSLIYILDLHGSAKKKEVCPDGTKDENVFDIQQGVAIGLFIKIPHHVGPAKVYHADLWGLRAQKYAQLQELELQTTLWRELKPQAPHFFFVPKDFDLQEEYAEYVSLKDIFAIQQNGIVTDRDDLFFDFEREVLAERMQKFYSKEGLLPPFSETYRVENSSSYELLARRQKTSFDKNNLHPCLYRPFDLRWLYYKPSKSGEVGLTSRPAWDVMRHMLKRENLALLSCRQQAEDGFYHVFCSQNLTERCTVSSKTRESLSVFPLYCYIDEGDMFNKARRANFKEDFIKQLEERLGMRFEAVSAAAVSAAAVSASSTNALFPELVEGNALFPELVEGNALFPELAEGNVSFPELAEGNKPSTNALFPELAEGKKRSLTFGPVAVFHYLYALLHSPTYRERYHEMLKIDFPRIPWPKDHESFAKLGAKGALLVDLHLLRLPGSEGVGGAGGAAVLLNLAAQGVFFEGQGSGLVEFVRYEEPKKRVAINAKAAFEGIEPEVWAMQIGGYQPLAKWLKDRKGKSLRGEEQEHYLRMVVALRETQRLMREIDALLVGTFGAKG